MQIDGIIHEVGRLDDSGDLGFSMRLAEDMEKGRRLIRGSESSNAYLRVYGLSIEDCRQLGARIGEHVVVSIFV